MRQLSVRFTDLPTKEEEKASIITKNLNRIELIIQSINDASSMNDTEKAKLKLELINKISN